MFALIARRLIIAVPTLIGLTLLVFFLVALAPGGVGSVIDQPGIMLEGSQHALRVQYLEERYGLNDPVLVQYARWCGRISPIKFGEAPSDATGFTLIPGVVRLGPPDLGMSFTRNRPVKDLIAEALPVTLLLNGLALFATAVIAIPTGIFGAAQRNSIFDRAMHLLLLALWSVPIVWAAVLLLGLLAGPDGLAMFPLGGVSSDSARDMQFLPTFSEKDGYFEPGFVLNSLWHLVLPVTCLTYGGLAVLARQTRAAVQDSLQSDYVRTARAKGASESRVILSHAFRNSFLPLITMMAAMLPTMVSGSLVVERVFGIPGMGSLIVDAIFLRDREILLANTLVIGIVTILAILLADILYSIADPRIRFIRRARSHRSGSGAAQ